MILNDRDKELFETLHSSTIGNHLVDYLKRLKLEIMDVRNLREGEDPKSRVALLDVIDEDLIDRIEIQHESKKSIINEYE